MQTFIRREPAVERMDDPDLDPAEHHRALDGLARINRLSRASATLRSAIRELTEGCPPPVSVLDVATGAGDLPIELARKGLHVEGCDRSQTAVEHANERARRAGVSSRFFCHDVLAEALPDRYDIVTCSLFLHHLTEDQVVMVLARMRESARRGVVVSDLRRSQAGYWLAWAGTRVLSRSPVVRFDGPASVRAAFTIAEIRELADRAGLRGARVEPNWPFRLLLTWRKV